jgi:hypothetical protein
MSITRISLTFETYATWFISSEIASASNFPNAFRDTVEAFTEADYYGPTDDIFWTHLAEDLIGDSQDDVVANAEALILLTDRADELTDDQINNIIDPRTGLTKLEQELTDYLEDDRLVDLLARAYRHQWDFYNEVMKNMEAQRSQQ